MHQPFRNSESRIFYPHEIASPAVRLPFPTTATPQRTPSLPTAYNPPNPIMDPKLLLIQTLVSHLSSKSDRTRVATLLQLRRISNLDPAARPQISTSGALPHLFDALHRSSDHAVQDHAAATLLNLSISDRFPLVSTPGLLDALARLLSRHRSSSASAIQSAAALLHSLLAAVPEFRSAVGARRDVLGSLVDIIKSPDSPTRSVKDGLKAAFGAALHPPNRAAMIDLGMVPALFAVVAGEKGKKSGIMEDATAVIAQIAGCEESEEAFRAVSGVSALLALLYSDNAAAHTLRTKENSVSALLNLVRGGGEGIVKEVRERAVLEAFDGIVFVQEHGSAKGKSKAVAFLKLILDGEGDKNFGDLYPI